MFKTAEALRIFGKTSDGPLSHNPTALVMPAEGSMVWRGVRLVLILWLFAAGGAGTALAQAEDFSALNAEADQLSRAGKFSEAVPIAQSALALAERLHGPDHLDVGIALNRLANLYVRQSRYPEAEPLYQRALAIKEKALGREHNEVGTTLYGLALLYVQESRYADAEPIYKRALAIKEKAQGREHAEVGTVLYGLAALYTYLGRYDEAEPLYKRVFDIMALGQNYTLAATVAHNLAVLYSLQDRYDEAEPLFKNAIAIKEKLEGPDHTEVGTALYGLAQLYVQQSRYAEAEPLYQRALAIKEKALGPEHPEVATTRFGLAELHLRQGHYQEAEPLYKRALAIDEKALGPDHPEVSTALNGLASLYFAQGQWATAADYWRRSTDVIIRRTKRGTEAAAPVLAGQSKSEAQRESYRFAALIRASAARVAAQQPAEASAGHTAGETFTVAQWAQASQAAASLAQMAARQAKGDGVLAHLARERQDLAGEWQVKDKAFVAARSEPPDPRKAQAEAALSSRLAEIDTRIAEINNTLAKDFPEYAMLSSPEPLAIADVQALLGAGEALLLFLDTPAWHPVQEATFIWVVTKTEAQWVGTNLVGTKALADKVQALRCGLDDAEWEGIGRPAQCNKLLGVGLPGEKDPLPFSFAMAHELYEALLGPVKDLIKDKHLLIVPSGPLTSLPFQVLVTDPPKVPIGLKYEDYRDVAWLARKQAITVLPSVASLKALREFAKGSPGSGVYVGYGDPVLSGNPDCPGGTDVPEACPGSTQMVEVASLSPRRERRGRRSAGLDRVFGKGGSQEAVLTEVRSLCPLPDTAQEIRCVARSLGVPDSEIRLKETATETDIKGLSESGKLATYKVIHFATHGLLAGDVEIMAKRQGEPALVLTPPESPKDADDDGLLTASEVTQLKLNADWVILSACNTAAGEKLGAEALSGLARAFFYAGDRALLVSHWPVYSDAAVRLITGTFAELKAHPEIGRAEAQRRAMVALMDDASQHDNPHPAVWAPFVVVGEGSAAAQ